ncbi:MAG: hypothetical protein KAS16_08675 [Thermoplasmata archaeon]|nr:hypothetical protein [Thermoplasmata archaeon]
MIFQGNTNIIGTSYTCPDRMELGAPFMARSTMKFVRISKMEFDQIRGLYESVMSQACHGLFFREGHAFGEIIAQIARTDDGDFLTTCGRLIKGRGWIDTIEFEGNVVTTTGSMEVSDCQEVTCHRVRGMLKAIYEMNYDKKFACFEDECESQGAGRCRFRLVEMASKE